MPRASCMRHHASRLMHEASCLAPLASPGYCLASEFRFGPWEPSSRPLPQPLPRHAGACHGGETQGSGVGGQAVEVFGAEDVAGEVGQGSRGFVCVVLASKSKEERTRDTLALVDWLVSCSRLPHPALYNRMSRQTWTDTHPELQERARARGKRWRDRARACARTHT